jgi:hypothetical protein
VDAESRTKNVRNDCAKHPGRQVRLPLPAPKYMSGPNYETEVAEEEAEYAGLESDCGKEEAAWSTGWQVDQIGQRDGLNVGELVVNNVVCGNRGFDDDHPATCEKYPRSVLPANARLTVWATQDGGRTWWNRTYVGTSERIVPAVEGADKWHTGSHTILERLYRARPGGA